MKIATWNLESLNRLTQYRKKTLHSAMEKVEADVWVLTETWGEFEPLPDYNLVAQSYPAEDLKDSDRFWVAIWVRSSLASDKLEIQSLLQRDRMAAVQIKNSNGDGIVVVGTVLPWNSDKLWSGADGFCAALAHQATEWNRLRETYDTCPFLVAGDFNQSLPNQLRYGSKQGAKELLETLKRQELFCLTQGNDPLTGKPRIDHICVSRSGMQPPFVPQVGTWAVPLFKGKQITDHSGAYTDLAIL